MKVRRIAKRRHWQPRLCNEAQSFDDWSNWRDYVEARRARKAYNRGRNK